MGKFIKDTIFTFIIRIFNLGLALGSSIIIARALGPEGKGIYSLAVLLPSLVIIFTNPGLGPATVYYVGQRKYSPKKVFGNNIIFSSLVSILASLIGLIIIFFFSNALFPNIAREYLLLALSLIPVHIFLSSILDILLAFQKIKKYNLVSFVQEVIFLFLTGLFFLGLHLGVREVIILEFISFFIACIVLFFWAKKETGEIHFGLDKFYFRRFLVYGIKVYLANVLSFLRKRLSLFLVNIYLNPLAVGFYSIASGLAEKIWLIPQSAGIVLFPRVSSETNKDRLKNFTPLVCRNVLFITFIVAILFFILSDWVIPLLYSETFLESIVPFKILLIGTVAISGSVSMANDISGRGKPMINVYLSLIVVIINIILSIILLPIFGILGAAWATTSSYIVNFILKTIVYSKISGNKITDVIFIKKSDLRFYKNFIIIFKNKYFNYSKNRTK